MIIAIDGVSSAGKSTLAKEIADRLNLTYIDTGAMYRVATLIAVENNFVSDDFVDDQKLISQLGNSIIDFQTVNKERITLLNGIDVEQKIRALEISDKVSLISKISKVREILVAKQREIGLLNGAVLDGRDIGTVVFPNADIKFFVTATIESRAKRRFLEYQQHNQNITLQQVMDNIEKRDYLDKNREISPLIQAPDAILIDNSNLNRQEQLDVALNHIKEKFPKLTI